MATNANSNLMKTKENFITTWSGWWFLAGLSLFLIPITDITLKNFYHYNCLWVYAIISFGVVPPTIIFWFERPYPFSTKAVYHGPIGGLTIEERKVLTFVKESRTMKKIIIIIGVILSLAVLIIPFTNIFFPSKQPLLFNLLSFSTALAVMVFYMFFSLLFFGFVIARFLLLNIDKIKKMNIKPWPIDKPYTPGPLWLKYRSEEKEKPSIFTEVLNLDPKTPFSWSDFGALILGFAGFVLIWSSFEAICRSFSGMGVIKAVSGFILFQVALKLWKIKHKTNKNDTTR